MTKEELMKLEQMDKDATDLQKAIKRNKKSRRFAIAAAFFLWGTAIARFIGMFFMKTGTLAFVNANSNLNFSLLLAFVYTIWIAYSVPKGDEAILNATKDFLKKYDLLEEEGEE